MRHVFTESKEKPMSIELITGLGGCAIILVIWLAIRDKKPRD